MKKLFITLCFLLMGFVAFSQIGDGRSMKPVMESMYNVVNIAEGNGLEIVRIEFDIVRKEFPKESYRVLTTDWIYRVGVFGDERVEDMDLEIYQMQDDGSYVFVDRDASVDPVAMIDFKPTKTTWYKFVVKCYKFVEGYSSAHYGLLVLHK